jgi:hypothetical protein
VEPRGIRSGFQEASAAGGGLGAVWAAGGGLGVRFRRHAVG